MRKHWPRIRRGRRRGDWQKTGGIVLIAVVVVIFMFGFYWLYKARQSFVPLHPETFCPQDGSPHAVTAVLIDTTDPLNPVQRTSLMHEVEELIADIQRYGALQLYAVEPMEEYPPKPVFLKCNPGRVEEISGWVENPRIVERQWRTGFRKPLEEVLDQMFCSSGSADSPILESIQWVTVNALSGPNLSQIPRRLVVISDLLQHTNGLSFYKGVVKFATFAKTRKYQRIHASLEGVSVDLLRMRRDIPVGVQEQALIRFWKDYFDAQGADYVRIVNLDG